MRVLSAHNPGGSLMMQIFLSYASEHREIADQVRQRLLNNGHELFFDRDTLPSAGNYHRRIAEAHRAWWRAEDLYSLRYALRPAADTTPQ